MKFDIEIPEECDDCKGITFNVWGTRMLGRIKVKVSCMRCGWVAYQTELEDEHWKEN